MILRTIPELRALASPGGTQQEEPPAENSPLISFSVLHGSKPSEEGCRLGVGLGSCESPTGGLGDLVAA